eukprot:1413820-Amphidinium_carterae.1
MSRQARLTTFFVPVQTVVNYVLKVLHSFSTPDTRISNLESTVGTFFMPNSSKRSVESSFP